MRLLFLFILTSMVAVTAFAQSENIDEEAKAILEKVSATYATYDAIKADFKMTIDIPDTDDDEYQEGSVYLQDDSYKLNLLGTEIITDNTTIWTYLAEVNEVQISYYEPEEGTITPSQIFTIYEKDFSYYYNGSEKLGDQKFETIDLTPNDKEMPYFKVRLWIHPKTNHIKQAKVFDRNGNRYIYEVENFDPTITIGEGFFNFDVAQYEDIEVIDLR